MHDRRTPRVAPSKPWYVAPALVLSLAACGGSAKSEDRAGRADGADDTTPETCETNPNLASCGPAAQVLELPEGYVSCLAASASTHGEVAVGSCISLDGSAWRSVRWDRSGAIAFLDIDGVTQASAVSADGSVTVGSMGALSTGGYRYDTALRESVGVGVLAVSADGNVFVGAGFEEQSDWNTIYAVRGHAGQADVERLAPAAEGLPTMVYDMSRDGRTSVGYARDTELRDRAAYWSEDGALHFLPEYPGAVSSEATGANGDGSVIIGTVYMDTTLDVYYPVRWTPDGIERIGDRVGNGADVSEDGRRIMIQYGVPELTQAIWTETSEHTILDWFTPEDFGRPADEALTGNFAIWALTPDGLAVVGQSYTLDGIGHAFIARLPE